MINSFADKHMQEFYQKGNSRRLQPDISKRTMRKLEYIKLATCLDDLRVPPSNRLYKLERERQGQYSIFVNDQWRICFRFIDGDACDGKITDYH